MRGEKSSIINSTHEKLIKVTIDKKLADYTVFGGNGKIGRRIVSQLISDGYSVFVPDRDYDNFSDNLDFGKIIYCAGITANFRKNPLDTVEAHIGLLTNILYKCRFDSLLYLSSTRIYGNVSIGSESSRFEVSPLELTDVYNLSKLMGESICLNCGRNGVKVARLSNVIGAETWDSPEFIPTIIQQARTGRIELHTTLSSRKDYIHIDDVVSLLIDICNKGRLRIYNVASGITISNSQWIEFIKYKFPCDVIVREDAVEIIQPEILIDQIRAEFNFEPKNIFESKIPLFEFVMQPIMRGSNESK